MTHPGATFDDHHVARILIISCFQPKSIFDSQNLNVPASATKTRLAFAPMSESQSIGSHGGLDCWIGAVCGWAADCRIYSSAWLALEMGELSAISLVLALAALVMNALALWVSEVLGLASMSRPPTRRRAWGV
jgi:hypothetical protein